MSICAMKNVRNMSSFILDKEEEEEEEPLMSPVEEDEVLDSLPVSMQAYLTRGKVSKVDIYNSRLTALPVKPKSKFKQQPCTVYKPPFSTNHEVNVSQHLLLK